jgi:hypothetical protein
VEIFQSCAPYRHRHPPDEGELLARLGAPLAREICIPGDPRLPRGVSEALTEFGLSSSIILAYRERAWGREVTSFVLLDSSSARLRTVVSMTSPYPEPINGPPPRRGVSVTANDLGGRDEGIPRILTPDGSDGVMPHGQGRANEHG